MFSSEYQKNFKITFFTKLFQWLLLFQNNFSLVYYYSFSKREKSSGLYIVCYMVFQLFGQRKRVFFSKLTETLRLSQDFKGNNEFTLIESNL